MKPKPSKKIAALFISIIMLITQICYPVTVNAIGTEDKISVDSFFSTSLDAQKIFASKKIIRSDELSENHVFNDGLSIIVGYNINIDAIKMEATENYSSSIIDQQKSVLLQSQSKAIGYDDISNTYMIMCMKNGERYDFEYISVTYAPDVSIDVINKFINYKTSTESIDIYAKNFICDQITNNTSAYNDTLSNSTRASSYTRVVATQRDTNYYIANYTTYDGAVYPLMVFKNDITYQATLVANELEDQDLYVIVAYVNITPGNSISSSEAEELSNTTGLCNTSYRNAIVVQGVRTIFENMFPEHDYYISMSPNNSLSDANGQSITVSLGLPPAVSVSYDLSFNTASTVSMSTSFDADGQCQVQFEGTLNALDNIIYNPCLSTEPFSYTAGVYLSSGGNILYTSVATDILFYFQYPGEDSAVWAGSAREFYYENTEFSEEAPIE